MDQDDWLVERGWLTTVVGRVCLDMLRARRSRREDSVDARVPDPVGGPRIGPTIRTTPCWRVRWAWRWSSCSRR
jgi:hypothetical protein